MMVFTKGNTNRECSLFWGARITWLRHGHPFYPIHSYRWGHTWHETKKKPLRWGCEGWRPIVGVMPKTNGKQAPPLSFAVTPTVARDARPSHPSPYRKKSRFAKKKSAPPKKNTPAAFFLSHEFIEEVTSHACRFFPKSRIYQIAARGKPPSEMAYCGQLLPLQWI